MNIRNVRCAKIEAYLSFDDFSLCPFLFRSFDFERGCGGDLVNSALFLLSRFFFSSFLFLYRSEANNQDYRSSERLIKKYSNL